MGIRLCFSCIGVVGGEGEGVELSDDDDDAEEIMMEEDDADDIEEDDDTKDDEDEDISNVGNVASVQYEPSDSPSLENRCR